MKQLTLFDLFDEAQSLTSTEKENLGKQSNISSNITASQEFPWLNKWQRIKDQYPDALLLFRVGDFYEAYNDDAKDASRILGITLTYRSQPCYYMCGFPYHAIDIYLPKLVRAGMRVAICDAIK